MMPAYAHTHNLSIRQGEVYADEDQKLQAALSYKLSTWQLMKSGMRYSYSNKCQYQKLCCRCGWWLLFLV